jgi:hypothetical protein
MTTAFITRLAGDRRGTGSVRPARHCGRRRATTPVNPRGRPSHVVLNGYGNESFNLRFQGDSAGE